MKLNISFHSRIFTKSDILLFPELALYTLGNMIFSKVTSVINFSFATPLNFSDCFLYSAYALHDIVLRKFQTCKSNDFL